MSERPLTRSGAETDAVQAFSAEDWSLYLSEELGRRVRVRFGRARRNVLVAKDLGSELEVRMNALFAEAPRDVRQATASWLRSGKRARRACEQLDAFVESLSARLAATPRKPPAERPSGAVYDLREMADELLATEFLRVVFPLGGPPAVTWGRRGRARRQIQLGSFDPETNTVRMHPVLDQEAVPRFFVRYVLFHEFLHAALPTPRPERGRAVHHGPAFRRRERAYPEYERALAWQEANLRRLLRSSASGEPMAAGSRRQRAAVATSEPRPTAERPAARPTRGSSGGSSGASSGATSSIVRAVQRWLFPD